MSTDRYFVPYLPTGSTFGQDEIDAVARVLRSGAKLSCGPERDAFEAEFAAYTGARHALSLTNATIALEFATYLLGLQPGDEVIAATQTYQANVTPLLGLPVVVRFCDIDPDTMNISPEAFAALVTERTRAVYLVHHGGNPADLDPIRAIADRHGIAVVEDCAHALGAWYHGRSPGTIGDLGCWSFQSYKNISTLGEGGMLTVSDDRWAEVAGRIRAIEPDADFVPRADPQLGEYRAPADDLERHAKNAYREDCVALRHPGTNSSLCEPAAAVGRVQLAQLDKLVARRREIAEMLDRGLAAVDGIRTQRRVPGIDSAHHLYTCFLDPETGIERDQLIRRLDAAGIQIQLRYFPVHLLPEWRRLGHGVGECPTAERVWFREQINLPIYPQLTDSQVHFMVETMANTLRELA
ncbi:DegT/DnrJ/EryC1/StrS family aminotransferase [Nocardia iowensis]|uniref:DegT/DnrJ/EryC1/StrS family aminotransferase n=1 Tax=Nocardia iowensis TaxID=204891 RepID=A0ABX8RMC4_NOCIO|nr:DegT/DnrJ/EryC1/StrS family aminotransferase [Nocardia iowensis]QXN90733.1 DegT/DnrJ/EryC1/StrS family aminotransferase [Nocardia iowensis]